MKLAEDLRWSVLQAAIEGKLMGGSQDNWRFVRLGEIGEIIGGGTPDTSKSEYWTHGQIAWITPADMGTLKSKYISYGARNITEKGLASSSARIMPKGSIIFSSRAPIGYIAIAENDLCTNQGCKSVSLYDGNLPEYVYFALLAMRDDIKKMGSGTTFKEISGRIFSSVVIPLPPIEEQHRIVSRLDEILPKIAELEAIAEPIARSCIVPRFDYKVITVVDVAIVRCYENIISNRYLNFVCNSKYFMNAAVSKARGSTRLRITRSHLAEILIPLPPLDEQKRIVSRLNELLPLCEALEKII